MSRITSKNLWVLDLSAYAAFFSPWQSWAKELWSRDWEPVVIRRWGSDTRKFGIQRVDKGSITTAWRLQIWVFERRSRTRSSCLKLGWWQALLKGHSQLVHMRIRYHFIANSHIRTLHLKKRVWRRKWEAHISKPRRIEVFPSQNSA